MSKQAMDEAFKAIEDALRIADRRTEIFDKAWEAIAALKEALQHDAEPVAWTERESKLFDGMIEVQKYHAGQCDRIGNRAMAEKQKGWDLERIALLTKCKAMLAASPQPTKEK